MFSRFIKDLRARRNPESGFKIQLVDGTFTNKRADGQVERVPLANLRAVLIETNSSGPFGFDVW